MNNHKKHNKVLAFEQLEGRQLMASVNGATVSAIVKAASQAHAGATQYITPQERLLNSIRRDMDKDLTNTMKATDKAHRDNAKDIAAAAKANNKTALKSEHQDTRDLERERRQSISEHETDEQFLERIRRRLYEGLGKYHSDIEANKVKALRGQQTLDEYFAKNTKIINEQLLNLNGIAEDAREVQAEAHEDQDAARGDIESIRKRRGSPGQGQDLGNFFGNPGAVTLQTDLAGNQSRANLTVNFKLDGNQLRGTLVKNAVGNAWDLATYEVENGVRTYVGNNPGRADDVTIECTLDNNGNVVNGTMTVWITPTKGDPVGAQTYKILQGKLSADRKSLSGNLAVGAQTLGTLRLARN